MRSSFIKWARGANITQNCNSLVFCHTDVFTWGYSPPEQGGKQALGKQTAPFYNAGQKRCTLCDERLEVSFNTHCGYVGHVARVGILERTIEILQKEEKENCRGIYYSSSSSSMETFLDNRIKKLLDTWWSRLNDVSKEPVLDYKRIPSLSACTMKQRLWRMRFLLQYLRDRGIIRYSLSSAKVAGSVGNTFVRSTRFERSEMIGDNIVKVVVPDRLVRLFPANEGGVTYKLACIQQLLDSNEGLLEIYDYLGLNSIIGVRLPNNKTKSDVVEALFGELQSFLWTSEVLCGVNQFPALPATEYRYVRALVDHLLNELTHMIIMWRIETTLENAKEYLLKCLQQRGNVKGGSVSSGVGESIEVNEAECDRARYAVLPLLLPFPYLSSSMSEKGHKRHALLKSFGHVVARRLDERGTPMMLFASPAALPATLALHYRTRMRVVRDIRGFNREVFTVLNEKEITSAFLSSGSVTAASGQGASGCNRVTKIQTSHKSPMIPRYELAMERYPTWRSNTKEAEMRQVVETHLRRRGAYVNSIDWNGAISAVVRDHWSSSSLCDCALQRDPTVRPVEPSGKEEMVAEFGARMAADSCLPPLYPTIRWTL